MQAIEFKHKKQDINRILRKQSYHCLIAQILLSEIRDNVRTSGE